MISPDPISPRLSLLFVVCLLSCAPVFGQPKVITGKVVRVVDGDTITIEIRRRERHNVRLKNIDAPEIDQDFGQQAKEHLANLVLGKRVRTVSNHYDREGKLVGRVVSQGRDIGLEMVVGGFAWHFRGFAHGQLPDDRRLFEAAEQNARRLKFNLWSAENPVPPWEFRSSPVSHRVAAP